jgi:hypothetical protein
LANLLKVERIGRAPILGPDIESDIEKAKEAEAGNFRQDLETLLRNFEEDEILPQEQSNEIPLKNQYYDS